MTLIERLEQATEGSRELDIAIGQLLHNSATYRIADDGSVEAYDDGTNEYGISGWISLHHEVSHYTTSIDAALTLVPEGFTWNLLTDDDLPGRARLYSHMAVTLGRPPTAISADGNTPALALCIASLRAQENKS